MLRWCARWQKSCRLPQIRTQFSRHASNNSRTDRQPINGPPTRTPSRAQQIAQSRWFRYTFRTLFAVLAGHLFFEYFYFFSPTYGISMLPTLNSFGDSVIISKYYRRGRGIKVGDLVSFRHPVRTGEEAVKRVIGLEGDFVLMNTPGKSDAMIQIPDGHCWVVGDNLLHSRDSRHFGPLPMALIVGKVTAQVSFRRWQLPVITRTDQGLQQAYVE